MQRKVRVRSSEPSFCAGHVWVMLSVVKPRIGNANLSEVKFW